MRGPLEGEKKPRFICIQKSTNSDLDYKLCEYVSNMNLAQRSVVAEISVVPFMRIVIALFSHIPVSKKSKRLHTIISNSDCSCVVLECVDEYYLVLVTGQSLLVLYNLFCSSVSDRHSVAAPSTPTKGSNTVIFSTSTTNARAEASFSFCTMTLSAAAASRLSAGLRNSLAELFLIFCKKKNSVRRFDPFSQLRQIVKISGFLFLSSP